MSAPETIEEIMAKMKQLDEQNEKMTERIEKYFANAQRKGWKPSGQKLVDGPETLAEFRKHKQCLLVQTII